MALTFSGAGHIRHAHSIDIADWIRQIVRGESRRVDDALIFIRERATADLGRFLAHRRIPHCFTVAAFLQGKPWIVQIRNFSVIREKGFGPVVDHFETSARAIPEEAGIAVPWPHCLVPRDLQLLMRVCSKKPRDPKHFMDLLAQVNARTAASARSRGTVSPQCTVHYMPPSGDGHSQVYNMPTGAPLMVPSYIWYGIDTTEFSRALTAHVGSLHHVGARMVHPQNLLKGL